MNFLFLNEFFLSRRMIKGRGRLMSGPPVVKRRRVSMGGRRKLMQMKMKIVKRSVSSKLCAVLLARFELLRRC